MKWLAVLLLLVGTAHAEDHGFTWGAFAGPGYDSEPGYRTGFDLELGGRSGNFELLLVNRAMVLPHTSVFETMALARVFVMPKIYIEPAAGFAITEAGHSGDFVAFPDTEPVLSLGVGYNVWRSDHWLLDARAIYTFDFNFPVGGPKDLSGIVVGPALRFYSN